MDKINEIIRNVLFFICIIGMYICMYNYFDTYKQDKIKFEETIERDVKNLNLCYQNAQEIYSKNWTRACKLQYEKEFNECLKEKVPENICKKNFFFDIDCALPIIKSNRLDNLREDMENNCNQHFKMKAEAYSSYLNTMN